MTPNDMWCASTLAWLAIIWLAVAGGAGIGFACRRLVCTWVIMMTPSDTRGILAAATDSLRDVHSIRDHLVAVPVALGRLGGQRGGAARAAKLSEQKRKQIARKAAAMRWAARTKKS